jgi:hypothetical protein
VFNNNIKIIRQDISMILKEIGNNSFRMGGVTTFRHGIENVKSPFKIVSYFKNSRFISASNKSYYKFLPIAIIRCRPDSNKILILEPILEAFVD